jgi:hypothetical protein
MRYLIQTFAGEQATPDVKGRVMGEVIIEGNNMLHALKLLITDEDRFRSVARRVLWGATDVRITEVLEQSPKTPLPLPERPARGNG